MKSSWCKSDTHEGCGIHMISQSTQKVFKCDCECHPKDDVKKKEVTDESDESDS